MAKTVVPVADLRQKPVEILPKTFDHHELRESQLLFNEEVEILEEQGEWMRVAAKEQQCYSQEMGWHGYEGWVHRSEIGEGTITPNYVVCSFLPHLSYGTYLENPLPGSRPLPKAFDRKQLVEEARLFLGAPYLWGGKAAPLKGCISSVDCSGLVQLLYRAQGIKIPRNAHDQFLFGSPVSLLQPGDLLYLAKESRINHVILKLEENLFIESPESGKSVRLLKMGADFWEKEGRWHFLDRAHTYKGFPISLEGAEVL